ncbi:hypothetical protein L2E82_40319 [Cichorium intybus]|uniref:Uncharacterized protein n=1 Tax=Cichorium intybus TaxID=13427 RepID=A0ACB9ALC3_CICIN|nr:hypothetical protein L2E82_40319 [Cichorium intybus]
MLLKLNISALVLAIHRILFKSAKEAVCQKETNWKYNISYVDGDEEILNLKTKKWEILEEFSARDEENSKDQYEEEASPETAKSKGGLQKTTNPKKTRPPNPHLEKTAATQPKQPPPPPKNLESEIHPAVIHLIEKMLTFDARHRITDDVKLLRLEFYKFQRNIINKRFLFDADLSTLSNKLESRNCDSRSTLHHWFYTADYIWHQRRTTSPLTSMAILLAGISLLQQPLPSQMSESRLL